MIVSGISGGLNKAAKKLGKKSSKSALLTTSAKIINTTMQMAEYVKNFYDISMLSSDLLDFLIQKLDQVDLNLSAQIAKGTYKLNIQKISKE
jgi:hypothetical protein